MSRKILLPLMLLLSVQIIFSQTVEKNKKDEISPELKKEATAFLRETAADVNSLRTLENRISFSSEMAGLMWFSDEKEARAMFQTVINDFRQLLTGYEAQIIPSGAVAENTSEYSLLSGSRNQAERKFTTALGVRQQIAAAIAEHDPELAFEFFSDTGAAITNPVYRQRIQNSDVYYETRLLNQIAEKNVETALKYGRKTLAKGFNYELVNLLKKIYAKDAEKGAAFGEEVISKLKSEADSPQGLYYLTRVLDVGSENLNSIKGKPDKRPMFSEQSLRDIAELAAQQILKNDDSENYDMRSYISTIEIFLPARAAQIRQKFDIKQKTKSGGIAIVAQTAPPPTAGIATRISADSAQENQTQIAENIKNLGSPKLSEEDRKKVIEQSRKIIAETSNREQKMALLTALAIQVAKAGDKETAVQLMGEVQSFVNLQPKNYRDFMEIWMLSGSYAQVDPQKAFPLLEDSILRLNDTISAFIKVGEFIDPSGEIIDDGEVQVGNFGGEMTRGMLGALGASNSTIRSLAIADFARTKDLTNKFDRTEVRILAKMLVLRGIFSDASKPKTDEDY